MDSIAYPVSGVDDILEWARRRVEEDNEGKVILDAMFFNATPALVGGWLGDLRGTIKDPYLLPEPPRPTDIAGKLRWWTRVALISALIDDLRDPEKDENMLRTTYRDIDEAIVKHLFGYISRIGAQSSIVRIRVEPTAILAFDMRKLACLYGRYKRPVDECKGVDVDAEALLREAEDHGNLYVTADDYIDYTGWAICAAKLRRVKLRTLGRKTLEDRVAAIPLPPGSYIFRLRVELDEDRLSRSQLDTDLARLLLQTSLHLFLMFSGIGGMTNRGYGKLGVLREGKQSNLQCRTLCDTRELITELKRLKRRLYELIDHVRERRYITENEPRHESKYDYVNLYIGTMLRTNAIQCMDARFKETWCAIKMFEDMMSYRRTEYSECCVVPVVAFVLGFPRFRTQNRPYTMFTMFFDKTILNRLPSLVRLVSCKVPSFSDQRIRLSTAGLFVKYLKKPSTGTKHSCLDCCTPKQINDCVEHTVQVILDRIRRDTSGTSPC